MGYIVFYEDAMINMKLIVIHIFERGMMIMKKGLLIGNGINDRIGITELKNSEIKKRFENNIIRFIPIIKGLFGYVLSEEEIEEIRRRPEKEGIESLADYLYGILEEKGNVGWTTNFKDLLQDFGACMAVNSIFFSDDGLIRHKYNETKMVPIEQYEELFSLNYYEFWDKTKLVKYLHGKVDLTRMPNNEHVMIVSDRIDLVLKERRINVDEIGIGKLIVRDLSDVVFAPSRLDKNELINVGGLFPSPFLYPGQDIHPRSPRKLYAELDEVDELDIFGVSPHGDNSLIEQINKKTHIRVFVFQKNSSDEVQVWKEKLNCRYEILDSEDIFNK